MAADGGRGGAMALGRPVRRQSSEDPIDPQMEEKRLFELLSGEYYDELRERKSPFAKEPRLHGTGTVNKKGARREAQQTQDRDLSKSSWGRARGGGLVEGVQNGRSLVYSRFDSRVVLRSNSSIKTFKEKFLDEQKRKRVEEERRFHEQRLLEIQRQTEREKRKHDQELNHILEERKRLEEKYKHMEQRLRNSQRQFEDGLGANVWANDEANPAGIGQPTQRRRRLIRDPGLL
mmetsp:Transcript_15744/g.38828  ORF Transcript_15744/g.38828 Transcript_15744/m.38828 type:complete len:233 (-) Transcript_15744:261-959(-)